MSHASEQLTLGELEPTPEDGEDPDPEIVVETGDTQSQCRNCGAHVTEQFARVCGDNDNVVHGCPDCKTDNDLYRGAAAGKEHDVGSNLHGGRL